jgi:hypothetical protein
VLCQTAQPKTTEGLHFEGKGRLCLKKSEYILNAAICLKLNKIK